ncbi:hypothetical protein ACQ4LE_008093 [Meloidogyne hapla]
MERNLHMAESSKGKEKIKNLKKYFPLYNKDNGMWDINLPKSWNFLDIENRRNEMSSVDITEDFTENIYQHLDNDENPKE